MGSPEDTSGFDRFKPPELVQETLIGPYVSPLALNERVVSVLASSPEGVLPEDLTDEVIAASPELAVHPEVTLSPQRVFAAVQDIRNLGFDIYTDDQSAALHIIDPEQ